MGCSECASVALQSTRNNNRLQTQPGRRRKCISPLSLSSSALGGTCVWVNRTCVHLCVLGCLSCLRERISLVLCGFFFCKMCGLVQTCDM